MTQPTTATSATPPTPALSTAAGIRLIAERELKMTVRSKAFIWGLILSVAVILIAVIGQKYVGQIFGAITGSETEDQVKVGSVLDDSVLPAGAELPFERQDYDSVDAGVEALKAGDIDALLVPTDAAKDMELYSDDGERAQLNGAVPITVLGDENVQQKVVGALTVSPNQAQLTEPAVEEQVNPAARMWTAMGFGLLFFTALMVSVQRLSQSIVEEKASRIVELLISSVSPNTILAGKILAGTILAVGQLLIIGAVLVMALFIIGAQDMAMQVLPAAGWFLLFTVFGYMLYAALYAAVSATLSRPEDVASATAPIVYLLMVPYLGPFLGAMNPTLMTWLSHIPISSPVAMPVRVFFGDAQWWEPLVSLAILIVTAVALILLAGRIYRNSILRTGGRVKMLEALKS